MKEFVPQFLRIEFLGNCFLWDFFRLKFNLNIIRELQVEKYRCLVPANSWKRVFWRQAWEGASFPNSSLSISKPSKNRWIFQRETTHFNLKIQLRLENDIRHSFSFHEEISFQTELQLDFQLEFSSTCCPMEVETSRIGSPLTSQVRRVVVMEKGMTRLTLSSSPWFLKQAYCWEICRCPPLQRQLSVWKLHFSSWKSVKSTWK